MADETQPPKDLIGFLNYYFVTKAPFQIPAEGKELIVKFGPWITVVLLALSLPALLFLLGVGTALMPFGGVAYATGFGYAAVLLVVELVLLIAALPGLFARKMSGWSLLFYGSIVSFVAKLAAGAVLSAIIGVIISFYILFQVRSLYK